MLIRSTVVSHLSRRRLKWKSGYFFWSADLSGCWLKCEKNWKYQDLKRRLKYEKSNFPVLNSRMANSASCFELYFCTALPKLWVHHYFFHNLRADAELNVCWLQKSMFPAGTHADLSGCRLKSEKNEKIKIGCADLSRCRLKCETTVPPFYLRRT